MVAPWIKHICNQGEMEHVLHLKEQILQGDLSPDVRKNNVGQDWQPGGMELVIGMVSFS